MQLDRVSVALRARDAWEAIDLGAAMIRSWWRPVYAAWFTVVFPIACMIGLLVSVRPWVALALLWWLKPLYDRVVLHVLGNAVFGAVPNARETLASLPHIMRSTGLLAALTWRRFDTLRAFHLPVRQLEDQHGKQASSRERVLGRRAAGHASGLLYVCLMFELVVTVSLGSVVDLVTPAALESEYGVQALFRHLLGADQPTWAAYANYAFFFLAICVIEPLYVASGFALYLNRRTTLEAWDLELDFRRVAAAPAGRGGKAVLIVSSVLMLGTVGFAHDTRAQQSSREIIREILASPEFEQHRTERIWQKRDAQEPSPPSQWTQSMLKFLQSMANAFAELVRYGAYALIAVGLYFLLRYLARELAAWQRQDTPGHADRTVPEVLFGLDVRPEALPANLAQAAMAVARSDPRAALSLLYRGALATLIHRDRLHLASGDTEGDCVARVARLSPAERSSYFARLVEAWSRTAYGRRNIDTAMIEALCSEWPRHFAAPR